MVGTEKIIHEGRGAKEKQAERKRKEEKEKSKKKKKKKERARVKLKVPGKVPRYPYESRSSGTKRNSLRASIASSSL